MRKVRPILVLSLITFVVICCGTQREYNYSGRQAFRVLERENSPVIKKYFALRALGQATDKKALPLLIGYLDSNEEVRVEPSRLCCCAVKTYSLRLVALESLCQLTGRQSTGLYVYPKDRRAAPRSADPEIAEKLITNLKKWWKDNEDRIYYNNEKKIFMVKK